MICYERSDQSQTYGLTTFAWQRVTDQLKRIFQISWVIYFQLFLRLLSSNHRYVSSRTGKCDIISNSSFSLLMRRMMNVRRSQSLIKSIFSLETCVVKSKEHSKSFFSCSSRHSAWVYCAGKHIENAQRKLIILRRKSVAIAVAVIYHIYLVSLDKADCLLYSSFKTPLE